MEVDTHELQVRETRNPIWALIPCLEYATCIPEEPKATIYSTCTVTSQDFSKFWGNFFAFILNALIEISQGFKTF
jgi:hypothetical protein